jgi:hypothetical protein
MDFSKYHFVYNAAAHFAAMEKYPEGIVAELMKPGTAGLESLCWALEEMSVQGDLLRRDMGHDKGATLNAKKLLLRMMPRDINEARSIVMGGIAKGLKQSTEAEEIDEVLAEIEKKTDEN